VPACIAGMHRSGTSMVARALAACGLELGSESELIGPTADNEWGHWEHEDFVALDDELLARLGGGWDVPPQLEDGWAEGPNLDDLRSRARGLASRFDGREPWGWKDPRTSLTLAFWRSVLSPLRVVVCVRHPVEVADSLTSRGASSQAFGLDLWLEYNRRLLQETSASERVVTHYASYFRDPHTEVRRVGAFLGLVASEQDVGAAAAAIEGSLRHNRAHEDATVELDDTVAEVYAGLCAEAGPVFEETLGDEPFFPLPVGIAEGPIVALAREQARAKAQVVEELRYRLRVEGKRAARAEERLEGLEGSRAFRYLAPLRTVYGNLRARRS